MLARAARGRDDPRAWSPRPRSSTPARSRAGRWCAPSASWRRCSGWSPGRCRCCCCSSPSSSSTPRCGRSPPSLSRPVLWLAVAFFGGAGGGLPGRPAARGGRGGQRRPRPGRRTPGAGRGTPLESHRATTCGDVHSEPLDRAPAHQPAAGPADHPGGQVLLLAVAVWLFFLLFGQVAIEDSVINSWVGDGRAALPPVLGDLGLSQRAAAGGDLPGGLLRPLLHGLRGHRLDYRDQFFHEITDELERAVGVRAAYLALRRERRRRVTLRSDAMEYRTLGSSGAAVSTYALGTMTFGVETDEAAQPRRSSTVFLEAGGTLVDTADVYGGDRRRERGDRRPLARRPPRRRHRPGGARHQGAASRWATDPNDVGLSRRHLDPGAGGLAAPAAGRRRRPLPGARLRPAHPARGDAALLRRRRARREGALRRAVELRRLAGAEARSTSPTARRLAGPVTLQPQYNLLAREVEWEIVPACVEPTASACSRGRRSAAAGSPGSTPETSAQRGDPARRGPRPRASRPTTSGPPASAPGRSSTPSRRSPRRRGVPMAAGRARLAARPAGGVAR